MKLPKQIKQGNTITIQSDKFGILTGEVNMYGSDTFFYLSKQVEDQHGFPMTSATLFKIDEYGKTWKIKRSVLSYISDKLQRFKQFMGPRTNGF